MLDPVSSSWVAVMKSKDGFEFFMELLCFRSFFLGGMVEEEAAALLRRVLLQ